MTSPPVPWDAWSPKTPSQTGGIETTPKPSRRYSPRIYELPEETILTPRESAGDTPTSSRISDNPEESGLHVVSIEAHAHLHVQDPPNIHSQRPDFHEQIDTSHPPRERSTSFPQPIEGKRFSGGSQEPRRSMSSQIPPSFRPESPAGHSSPRIQAMSYGDLEVDRRGQDICPPLVQAASDGRGALVERILAKGESRNAVHPETKRTALIEASEKGYFHIVELLLDHGCSTKCRDSRGMTALHHAAQKGFLLVAKALLDRGAIVNTPGSSGFTPLHLASWVHHANMVVLLLERRADVQALDTLQRTALHIAASHGFTDICNILVNHGADSESRDGNMKTPLQLSIEARHFETSEELLSLPKLCPTDMGFLSALFAAIEAGHIPVVDSFIRRGASLHGLKEDAYKPITLATKSGNPAMVDLMVRNHAKVKGKDESGWTALHYAASHGHIGIIERFADKEIPTSVVTFKKETALHLAVKASNLPATNTLLKGQGRLCISFADSYGQEPLHHAARVRNMEIVDLLISTGAHISSKNAFGWKPLHIAVAYGSLPIVTHLLKLGASIEDRLSPTNLKQSQTQSFVEDGYWAEARWPFPGSRSLHLAIEFGHDEIARYLIDQGARIEPTCAEGWRPLHLAAFNSSLSMVEYLLSKGVYPHAVTDTLHHRTPLDIAKFRSRAGSLPNSVVTTTDVSTTAPPPAGSEADAARVWWLLNETMATTPKKANEVWKKHMKVIAGKGPEEKWECLKAVRVAENAIGVKRMKQLQLQQQGWRL